MQKLGKRFLATTLALFTISSVFAGCGKTGAKPADSSAKATAAADEKKPTLKVLGWWQQEDYNTYPVAKVLEDKTGYHVEYEALPADKWQDKLNLLLASGDSYDLMTIAGGADGKSLYADYAQKGALMEVTPLIDKFGPNVKTAVSQQSLDIMKVKDKIYGIPVKGTEYAGSCLVVRQDWLDKLNMKMPTTVDEFVTMLKAFKDKDPGGNGDKNIPMTFTGNGPYIGNLVGAFGMANRWNDINGKLTPMVLDPAIKDYASFMGDLYKQGLVDKEFPTNQDATSREKFTSGRAGVLPYSWSGISTAVLDPLTKNKPDAKVSIIPTLKGKDGKFGVSVITGVDRISFIPKNAKNPEHVMKWINAKLDKDTFKLLAIGEEGKHYNVKDGAYIPILPIFNDERGAANNYMTGVDEKNYPTYWQARVRKDPRQYDVYATINIKEPADTRKPDALGYAPYLPNFSKNDLQLKTMENDYMVKAIVAGGANDLDSFVQKWKAAGGDASYKDINDWYPSLKK